MGVQTKILVREYTGTVERQEGEQIVTKNYTAATAALVGGTPGQIYDVAYGPVVHTTNLPEAADIGTFVEGRGIIINSPEYALYGKPGNPLEPSLTLPKGTVVSVMTAGHVWVQRKALADIQAGMNTYIIYEPDGNGTDDLCVVEVNGLKPAGGDSDSNG